MADTTIGNTAAANAANAKAGDSTALGRARLAENFDTFLSLLTTQLKNQDPLSPMDSNQFTQQLTQMTGVEQQLATNDLLKQLVSNTSSGLSTAIGLIGKQVKAVSDDAALVGGKANWIYNLGSGATDVKVEVLDEKGNIVAATAIDKPKAGDNTFTWDGKDRTGNKMPEGTYTLRVTAKDADGQPVDHITYVSGLVTGVEQENGTTMITVGGAKVSWEKVTSVLQPPEKSATTTADNSTTTPPTEEAA